MRPVRIITAVIFAAAVAVTGCAAHSTAVNPPVPPVVDAPAPPAPSPAPKPIPLPVPATTPAPKAPVLADGHYDAYIQQVNTRSDYLVVDLVQVFQGQAAIDTAIADGLPRDQAQVLYVWVRNQNPRLRTLPMASGVVVKLWGSCEESSKDRDAAFNALAEHASQKGTYYYTLTVSHGKVQRIQEQLAINAC